VTFGGWSSKGSRSGKGSQGSQGSQAGEGGDKPGGDGAMAEALRRAGLIG
jgi:hypothetical protein